MRQETPTLLMFKWWRPNFLAIETKVYSKWVATLFPFLAPYSPLYSRVIYF